MHLRNHMRALASTATLVAIACPTAAHAGEIRQARGGIPTAAHQAVAPPCQSSSIASSGATDGPQVHFSHG